MQIPWAWIFLMTLFEVAYSAYKRQKDQDFELNVGIIMGMWLLVLVSYMEAHLDVIWK